MLKSRRCAAFIIALNVYLHVFDLCCQGSPAPISQSLDSAGSKDADDIFNNDCELQELIVEQAEKFGNERADDLCPSIIKVVNDSDRFPKTLLQLECVNPCHGSCDTEYCCKTVTYEMPVLKKYDGSNWKWIIQTLNVGCRAILNASNCWTVFTNKLSFIAGI